MEKVIAYCVVYPNQDQTNLIMSVSEAERIMREKFEPAQLRFKLDQFGIDHKEFRDNELYGPGSAFSYEMGLSLRITFAPLETLIEIVSLDHPPLAGTTRD